MVGADIPTDTGPQVRSRRDYLAVMTDVLAIGLS